MKMKMKMTLYLESWILSLFVLCILYKRVKWEILSVCKFLRYLHSKFYIVYVYGFQNNIYEEIKKQFPYKNWICMQKVDWIYFVGAGVFPCK